MDIYPDPYYEGVAAYPDDSCPYPHTQLFNRCWWMAGYHDARRDLV